MYRGSTLGLPALPDLGRDHLGPPDGMTHWEGGAHGRADGGPKPGAEDS